MSPSVLLASIFLCYYYYFAFEEGSLSTVEGCLSLWRGHMGSWVET